VIGGSAQVRITNCIAYFNSAGGGGNNFWDYSSSGFTNTYSHCCLTPAPAISAATNITANPLFMDGGSGYGISFVSGDFHLQKGSPCVNAGANAGWMATGKDLDNKPRLDPDGVADIGAYEFIPVVGTLTFIK
jgi:hypothetical protein